MFGNESHCERFLLQFFSFRLSFCITEHPSAIKHYVCPGLKMGWTKENKMENQNIAETSTEVKAQKPTFDELLKQNPDYQAEMDRKFESARGKWEAKWQKEAEQKQSEAQMLANASTEEKHQKEIDALKKQLEALTKENNAKSLKD